MNTKHFDYLDSLRGIACMMVVFLHTIQSMKPGSLDIGYTGATINYCHLLSYPPFSLLVAGNTAVCIFFILSGYVLSYRFLSSNERSKIIEAIIKRPVRLSGVIMFSTLPTFYFLLTKDFWTNRLWLDYDVYFKTTLHFFTSIFHTSSLASNNPPLWTIGIELWGSFLVFALCLFMVNIDKKYRLFIFIILMLFFINTFYSAFVFGMMIADLHKNWHIKWFVKNKNMLSWIIFMPSILLCAHTTSTSLIIGDIPIKYSYYMLGSMLFFVFVVCNNRIKNILNGKGLVFIGSISYSIYVLHALFLYKYLSSVKNISLYFSNNIYISSIITITISTMAIIVIAYLVDKYIDKPCIKFSSWFAKKLVGEIKDKIKSTISHQNAPPPINKALLLEEKIPINLDCDK